MVSEFSETLPDVFTAAKFGRFEYTEELMKATGEYYYLSQFYGIDLEILNVTSATIQVIGYPPIIVSGVSAEDRAVYLADQLEALDANFIATAIGTLVHFETTTAITLTTTDVSVVKLSSGSSNGTTKEGYLTSLSPTDGFDNPIIYVESRYAVHAILHRPILLSGPSISPSGIGELELWPENSNPYGLLACDGTIYSVPSYSNLYAVVGTTYNTGGEPADTFRVPTLSTAVIDTQNFTYYIRNTRRATMEADMVFFSNNPVMPFKQMPDMVTGVSNFDIETATNLKTQMSTNTVLSLSKVRPGRKFNLSVKSISVATLTTLFTTDYTGVSLITTHYQNGVETVAGSSTVSFTIGDDKMYEIEAFVFGTTMHVYITVKDFL